MRTLALITVAAAAFAAVTSVSAAPREMTDSTYIAVAKCAGMAEGIGADAAPFKAVLDQQSGSRLLAVTDRADEARTDAKRAAAHAGQDGKTQYGQEVEGACKSYIAAG